LRLLARLLLLQPEGKCFTLNPIAARLLAGIITPKPTFYYSARPNLSGVITPPPYMQQFIAMAK